MPSGRDSFRRNRVAPLDPLIITPRLSLVSRTLPSSRPPTPYTLHPTPYTLHPTPSSLFYNLRRTEETSRRMLVDTASRVSQNC